MRRPVLFIVVVIGLVSFVAGCGTESSDTAERKTSRQQSGSAVKSATKPDTLPLLPIMVNLEEEMTSISSGLWRHNFEQIEQSAKGIANHAKIPKAQLGAIKKILGEKRFKAFVQDDKTVHTMAVKLSEAAAAEDFARAATIYQKLERGCISCHRKHRNDIRNSSRW